jgi:hypothetical protein
MIKRVHEITITELIDELQGILNRRGDLPVRIATGLETSEEILMTWEPAPEEPVVMICMPNTAVELQNLDAGLPTGPANPLN